MSNLSNISAYSNFSGAPSFRDQKSLSSIIKTPPAINIPNAQYIDKVVVNSKNALGRLCHWHHAEALLTTEIPNLNPVIFTNQLLEFLPDPRPFLYAIKRRLVLGGEAYIQCYDEPTSARWDNNNTLINFLIACGFSTTRIQNQSQQILKLEIDKKNQFIDTSKLDPINTHTIIVTTEDAEIAPCGGIGTYIKTIRRINKNVCILYANYSKESSPLPERTISPLIFGIEFRGNEDFFWSNSIIETLKCIILLLPNLETIEFQDYQSVGLRITQARLCGVFPSRVRTRAFLHGPIDHVKHGLGGFPNSFYSYHELQQAVADNFIFNKVDEAFSPSSFLSKNILENEFGHRINNLKITGLPFISPPTSDLKQEYSEIKNIAFIGKYNALKGWNFFHDAIQKLSADGELAHIDRIVTLTPVPSKGKTEFICQKNITFEEFHLPHTDFINYIRAHNIDTLFVVPAAHENYPYVALETTLNFCRTVYFNKGGLAELFYGCQAFAEISCPPSAAGLAAKMKQALMKSSTQWSNLTEELFQCISQKIDSSNSFFSTLGPTIAPSTYAPINFNFDCTIVIPVYNTDIFYLNELFDSISRSTLQPAEILIVNDGSREDYINDLISAVKSKLTDYHYKVLTKENGGLASARNFGIKQSKTKFAYCIDSDDILLPNTLIDSITALNINSDAVIAAGFAINFSKLPEAGSPVLQLREGCYWKPLGVPEAKALGFYQNEFIPASAMVNVKKILEIGAWDEYDKSTWEDFALYEKIAWQGGSFLLIPEPGYLYRNTPGSMSKTYNRYYGRRRLIRNIGSLSKLDSNILFNLISNADTVTPNELRVIRLLRRIRRFPMAEKCAKYVLKIVRPLIFNR